MARREAAIHPLPDWFDLRAYDVLLELTNDQLVREASLRFMGKGKLADLWCPIMSANNVLISPQFDDMAKTTPFLENFMLFEGAAVQPIDFGHIYRLHEFAEGDPVSVRHPADSVGMGIPSSSAAAMVMRVPMFTGNGSMRLRPSGLMKSVSLSSLDGGVDVSIYLDSHTDAEILVELAELLPMWRKQLDLPEPNKKRNETTGRKRQSEESIIKKLIEYRIIPMLDLILWAELNGFEYTAEQLSRDLYPNELVSDKHVRETRFPFACRFLNHDFNDMTALWLRQTDRGTGKRNGDRLVKDTIAGTG